MKRSDSNRLYFAIKWLALAVLILVASVVMAIVYGPRGSYWFESVVVVGSVGRAAWHYYQLKKSPPAS